MVSPLRYFSIKIFILAFSFQLSAFSCFAYTGFIRVAIIQEAESVSLKIEGLYEILDSTKENILYRGKNLNTTVGVSPQYILIGDHTFVLKKIMIKTAGSDIVINGRRFKGNIWLINRNGRLLVVNELGLEDYLKGILYHEVSHYWPQEALKAQAVACRTFAVYQIENSTSKDYDVTSDIYSQVYGGRTSERYRTNLAVEETKGQILTYQDKVFPTYYHATCAGYTEDASLLWNIDIAPLKGLRCEFCKGSPHFRWQAVISLKEIEAKLASNSYNLDRITNITVLEKSNSGRILKLKISTNSKNIEISGKDFRNILGPNLIRSTKFVLEINDADAVFIGYGWGHGVGMCQWGAYFMAKNGYSYKEILSYYYPGSSISLISNLQNDEAVRF